MTGVDWSAGAGRMQAGGKSLEWGAFGPPPGDAPGGARVGAPVIVMLHEGLGCLALWRDFPERLAQKTGHPVFAYSRAGYGQSGPADLPRPLDYMTREALEVLPGVLSAAGAAEYILLGHSDGATIAAVYAGEAGDDCVKGVIMLAPHFFTEPKGLAEIAAADKAFRTTNLKSRMAKYHRDPENAFRGWNDAWLDPDFESWNVEHVIGGFRVPALALQGRQDQYGTLAQIETVKARSPAPAEILVIEDCRHSPHLDQPEAVLAAVSKFTARLKQHAA